MSKHQFKIDQKTVYAYKSEGQVCPVILSEGWDGENKKCVWAIPVHPLKKNPMLYRRYSIAKGYPIYIVRALRGSKALVSFGDDGRWGWRMTAAPIGRMK